MRKIQRNNFLIKKNRREYFNNSLLATFSLLNVKFDDFTGPKNVVFTFYFMGLGKKTQTR